MRIATWNVNSLNIRLDQVLDWLQTHEVDVLALQETKCQAENFPHEAFSERGFRSVCVGQKSYNGVALITPNSAPEFERVETALPGLDDTAARFLAGYWQDWCVASVYVPNGQAPDSEKFVYKLNWLRSLLSWVKATQATTKHLVVLGDYNITFNDLDVYDPIAWAGQIHCTDEERSALGALVEAGLCDTLRQIDPTGVHYTWWDYRAARFRRNQGLRIDHILASPAVVAQTKFVWVDTTPRTHERPSDHAPLVWES